MDAVISNEIQLVDREGLVYMHVFDLYDRQARNVDRRCRQEHFVQASLARWTKKTTCGVEGREAF